MPPTTCPSCHRPFPADARFCPECGFEPGETSPATAQLPADPFSGLPTVTPIRPASNERLAPGSRFAERYEVVREIGAGGMGVVYLATDTHTGLELVLKLIHPALVGGEDAVKRLMAEGLTARQIRHPKVVAVYDVARYHDQPYFTMEYVRGITLRSWMANHFASRKDVPFDTAVGLVKSMLAGIAEAHRVGIVHRDLKPENVLLTGDPNDGNFDLKIVDFGLARVVKAPRTTAAGSFQGGTPRYMAPEQEMGRDVSAETDIYSLSAIFYELLMESPPHTRWEPVSKNRRDVPKGIDDLIEKGLSVRPRDRHASAAEFENALDAVLKTMGDPLAEWRQYLTPQPPSPAPGPPPGPTPQPPPPLPQPAPQPQPAPAPQPIPQPGPGPAPVRRGYWASMSRKARGWTIAAAAVVVFYIIGSFSDDARPAPTPIPDPIPGPGPDPAPDPRPNPAPRPRPAPDPAPTPEPPSRTERWRDDFGNAYVVERDGASFEGSSDNVRFNGISYGHVDIQGVVSPAGGNIMMTNQFGVVYQSPIGASGPGSDPRTTDAMFGTVRFHIDH
jgi:serine/threonine protein kinase